MEPQKPLLSNLKLKKVRLAHFFYAFCFLCQSSYSNEISLLFGKQFNQYKEYSSNGTLLDTEKGWLNAHALSFKSELSQAHSLLFSLSESYGTLPYVGHTQNGSPHVTRTQEKHSEYHISYFYSPSINRTHTYGIGIDHHDWLREIQPGNGVLGLNEDYSWDGISVYHIFEKSQWQFASSLSYLYSGNVEVDLSEVGSGFINVPLHSGLQAEYGITFITPITAKLSVLSNLIGVWRYIPKGEPVQVGNTAFLEPESEFLQMGVSIGIKYSF
jgi:hypothetical protein